jgi:hypothetical protein
MTAKETEEFNIVEWVLTVRADLIGRVKYSPSTPAHSATSTPRNSVEISEAQLRELSLGTHAATASVSQSSTPTPPHSSSSSTSVLTNQPSTTPASRPTRLSDVMSPRPSPAHTSTGATSTARTVTAFPKTPDSFFDGEFVVIDFPKAKSAPPPQPRPQPPPQSAPQQDSGPPSRSDSVLEHPLM